MSENVTRTRLIDNPFHVLEVGPECSRAEFERAGQKLLAMLELNLAGADQYSTPAGLGRRDPAKVREAMAELRDPQRRLLHELWALRPGPHAIPEGAGDLDDEPVSTRGFAAALTAMGWR